MSEEFVCRIYRYHPEQDQEPRMQAYTVPGRLRHRMVLDVLEHLKTEDDTLTFRRSCREGVCGSDGMNINGVNRLACTTRAHDMLSRSRDLVVRPLTGMPVIRDLVVDLSQFQDNLERVRPRSEERRVGKARRRKTGAHGETA